MIAAVRQVIKLVFGKLTRAIVMIRKENRKSRGTLTLEINLY